MCDSKCKTCSSSDQCNSCYGNFEGTTCSTCKSGWNGLNCSTPICDSKCLNCSSPAQCSVCSGNFNGVTCSTCKSGWTGSDCNIPVCDSKCTSCSSPGQCSDCTTPICDSKCTSCSSPGNCATCSGNWVGSTCKSGWTGSDCNSIDKTGEIATSSVLTIATHRNRFMNEIMNGVSLKGYSQPTLLFRATRDGFSASAFHTQCNYKGYATIVIVKSTSGAIFGGYTSASWGPGIDCVSDPSAFMFSLISSTGEERFTKLTQQHGWYKKQHGNYFPNSICHYDMYGPVFGVDLLISDNANTMAGSIPEKLCHTYCDTTMTFGTDTARLYLTGSNQFLVSEYEVYTF